MEIRHQLQYDASPDEVYAMLTDRAFREKVARALGTVSHEITVEPTDSGHRVGIDMVQPTHGVPGFAKKIVGEQTRVVQSEQWVAGTGAALEVEIPGKPGHVRGNITLLAEGARTVEAFKGEAKIGIPLVGGKLEKLIEQLFIDGMDTEHRVGLAWLRGER
jgi:uncharacterized protein YndB with AHSA1/START domain